MPHRWKSHVQALIYLSFTFGHSSVIGYKAVMTKGVIDYKLHAIVTLILTIITDCNGGTL